jgi:hypothetical protein
MSSAAVPRYQLLFHVISCCSKVAAPVAMGKVSEARADVAFAATMATIVSWKLKLLIAAAVANAIKNGW